MQIVSTNSRDRYLGQRVALIDHARCVERHGVHRRARGRANNTRSLQLRACESSTSNRLSHQCALEIVDINLQQLCDQFLSTWISNDTHTRARAPTHEIIDVARHVALLMRVEHKLEIAEMQYRRQHRQHTLRIRSPYACTHCITAHLSLVVGDAAHSQRVQHGGERARVGLGRLARRDRARSVARLALHTHTHTRARVIAVQTQCHTAPADNESSRRHSWESTATRALHCRRQPASNKISANTKEWLSATQSSLAVHT
jgi:hypothetical protein